MSYEKGRRTEQYIRDKLRDHGHVVVLRMAQSKPVDLVSGKHGRLWVYQVSRENRIPKPQRKKACFVADQLGGYPCMVTKRNGNYVWYPPDEYEGRWIHPLHGGKECAVEGCRKAGSLYLSGEGPFCEEHFGRKAEEAAEKGSRVKMSDESLDIFELAETETGEEEPWEAIGMSEEDFSRLHDAIVKSFSTPAELAESLGVDARDIGHSLHAGRTYPELVAHLSLKRGKRRISVSEYVASAVLLADSASKVKEKKRRKGDWQRMFG